VNKIKAIEGPQTNAVEVSLLSPVLPGIGAATPGSCLDTTAKVVPGFNPSGRAADRTPGRRPARADGEFWFRPPPRDWGINE
jgi:hypothetical protein